LTRRGYTPSVRALIPTLLLLSGCTSVYRMPGPLGAVGHDADYPAPASSPAPVASRTTSGRAPRASNAGQAVADAACAFEGSRSIAVRGVKYRFDCSGFVEAAMDSAGVHFEGSSRDLFEAARERGVLHRRHRPEIGDVAFFDDTYDKDGDGRVNDPLSHVAVVVRVDGDGTIGMLHLGGSGITSLTMNLRDPETHLDAAGQLLNDYLRAASKRDTAKVKHMAGELWVAFGSLWKAEAVATR